MDRSALIEELRGIISRYVEGQGFDFVDLIYRYEGRDLFLRVLADWPEGGINLDECARLNREIGLLLDEKNIIQQRYILEVSSPGLDRPLQNKKDFLRCLNKNIKFFLKDPIAGKLELEGKISKVEEDSVFVEAGSSIVEIPLLNIGKAKQII